MPSKLNSSISKKIYVEYFIGNQDAIARYSEPHEVYSIIDDPKGYYTQMNIGSVADFDRVITFDDNSMTEFITDTSRLYVETTPNKKENADFMIKKVSPRDNGQFVAYCNSLSKQEQSFYFVYNGVITDTTIQFNATTLVGVIPINRFLPIDELSNCWYTKPSSIDSTINKLRLVSKEQVDNSFVINFEMVIPL